MAGPVYGGSGVTGSLRGQPTNVYELVAGGCALVPAGKWQLELGPYLAYQEYDIITGIWRSIGSDTRASRYVNSDGANFRVANQSGCLVGALVTNGGSGYTSPPTVVPTSGAAILQAVLGYALASVSVQNGGTNYQYPPQVVFSAPGPNGVQATGYATISGGIVTAVTLTDVGAGYVSPPTVTFINDPREGQNGLGTGSNAAATAALTAGGSVVSVLVLDHGNVITGTSPPTFTITGGGGTGLALTAIMNWAITGYTVTTSGTGYTGVVEVTGLGGLSYAGAAYTNPNTQNNLLRTRRASILAALSGANITATGQTVYDGGAYPGLPSALILNTTPETTAAALSFTMGGFNDSYRLFAA